MVDNCWFARGWVWPQTKWRRFPQSVLDDWRLSVAVCGRAQRSPACGFLFFSGDGWGGGGGGGSGWVRQRCRVSCVTGASNWYWLTIVQGLLSLQQVKVEGECFYFFCFFTFIHFPLSSLSLSFLFHLLHYLFCLSSPFLWETTEDDVSLNPNTINQKSFVLVSDCHWALFFVSMKLWGYFLPY